MFIVVIINFIHFCIVNVFFLRCISVFGRLYFFIFNTLEPFICLNFEWIIFILQLFRFCLLVCCFCCCCYCFFFIFFIYIFIVWLFITVCVVSTNYIRLFDKARMPGAYMRIVVDSHRDRLFISDWMIQIDRDIVYGHKRDPNKRREKLNHFPFFFYCLAVTVRWNCSCSMLYA